jgi:hypothetical protein
MVIYTRFTLRLDIFYWVILQVMGICTGLYGRFWDFILGFTAGHGIFY